MRILVIVYMFYVLMVNGAPSSFLLDQQQNAMQESLQNQLMEMQYLQRLKQINAASLNQPNNLREMPVLIIMPITINAENDNDYTKSNNGKNKEPTEGFKDEDNDSVVIDAEPDAMESLLHKTYALGPKNQRQIIGSIISLIPFLPIEVNVPDTISWIYNGISSIISGISQALPNRPGSNNKPEGASMRFPFGFFGKNSLTRRQDVLPIIMLPLPSHMNK